MLAASSYDYAIIRLVPRVERGECMNVGVLLFCRTRRFLGARVHLEERRALALASDLDLQAVREQLDHIVLLATGPKTGPFAHMSQSERFHWLVAPRSTIIQTSPVHSGLCSDPESALRHLVEKLVL